MTDISEIAEGLTPAQRTALQWVDAPDCDPPMLFAPKPTARSLLAKGLVDHVERAKGRTDWWKVATVTATGLAVREHLLKEGGE